MYNVYLSHHVFTESSSNSFVDVFPSPNVINHDDNLAEEAYDSGGDHHYGPCLHHLALESSVHMITGQSKGFLCQNEDEKQNGDSNFVSPGKRYVEIESRLEMVDDCCN